MSDQNSTPKHKRGAQPGNLNAYKHGLYLEGKTIRNTTPFERAQLFDLNNIIIKYKEFMTITYEQGLKCRTVSEVNDTMRSLAIASMALVRLLNLHNQFQSTSLPGDMVLTRRSTVMNLVEHYKKKMASFMDLSDLDLENEV